MRVAIMITPLLAVATTSWAEPTQVITLTEREPIAFILNTPTGAVAHTSTSEIIRTVSDLLRRDTSLALAVTDPEVVRTCSGQLLCLVLAARTDYKRAALVRPDGTVTPYRAHVHQLKEDRQVYARYLLLLSNITIEGQADRLSAVLIDTDLALGFYHVGFEASSTWKDDVEAKIASGAARTALERTEVRDADEANQVLERLFEKSLSKIFESTGHWRPYGDIDIETDVANMEIVLDGTTVGTTQTGVTRLARAMPGERHLVFRHPEFDPYEGKTTVRRGEVATVEVEPNVISTSPSAFTRGFVFWTGVGLAAAGAGVTVFALTRQDGDVRTVCFSPNCPGGSVQTLGYNPQAGFTDPNAVNPSGVLVAPLGLALLGAGGAFSLGVGLTDEDTSPWWGVLAGILVSGAVYGIGTALH